METIRRLFEKGKIGTMTVRNRIVMAPMATNSGTWDSCVSDEMIDYYVARAKGGVGLIIVQATAVVPESQGTTTKWLNIFDDKYIPRLRQLSEAVKAHGANIALQLWHGVTVYEKSSEAGGQWNIAAQQPGKEAFSLFKKYLITALGKQGVTIHCNSEVTVQLVKDAAPDVIILATGAIPAKLDVPGIDGENVVQGNDVITGKAVVGKSAVVVGANYLGMELAAELAQKGKKVILLEALDKIGPEVAPAQRVKLLGELESLKVEMVANAAVTEITESGVRVKAGENSKSYHGETVVLTVGAKPLNDLADAIRGLAPEFYSIGDCVRPRRAVDAVHEGANLALKI